MERALVTLLSRENRARVYQGLASAAHVEVSPRGAWLLYRLGDHGPIAEATLARRLGTSGTDLGARLAELEAAGYVIVSPASPDGAQDAAMLSLTPAGEQAVSRLNDAREAGIERLAAGWHPDQNPELRHLIERIARTLAATDRPLERDMAAVSGTGRGLGD